MTIPINKCQAYALWHRIDRLFMQIMRKHCDSHSHKALVTRLLFILTRCSRLVVTGKPPPPPHPSPWGQRSPPSPLLDM